MNLLQSTSTSFLSFIVTAGLEQSISSLCFVILLSWIHTDSSIFVCKDSIAGFGGVFVSLEFESILYDFALEAAD